jgi:hypothetical protein
MRTNEQSATQAALDALQSVSAGNSVGFLQKPMLLLATGSHSRHFAKRLDAEVKKLITLGQTMRSSSLIQVATALETNQAEAQKKQVPTENFNSFMGDKQQSFYDSSGFGPIIKLLSDLITRLEEEAAAETSQHEWCDNEKTNGVNIQQEREQSIHALTAEVDQLTTSTSTLKSEIDYMQSELERVARETAEAKAIRAEQKKAYETARSDHEEVISAIGQALAALGGAYPALLQVKHRTRRMMAKVVKQPGQTPFGEYSSGSAAGGSAMDMLTDLQGRYSQALEEIILTEEEQVKAHEELLRINEQFRIDTTNA